MYSVSIDSPTGWLEVATGFSSEERALEWAAELTVAHQVRPTGHSGP